ncbi:hypothetical protein [Rhizobium sp. 2MFCol3.1]|uniref:hypothetical protein n=1 Tax=Rhizobium sp. 2MFCol3.1 TaxID=1246459 RepID=UPI00035E9042|nr:hypothetical protein [Rhizobium sp. 2MFCol3.1]
MTRKPNRPVGNPHPNPKQWLEYLVNSIDYLNQRIDALEAEKAIEAPEEISDYEAAKRALLILTQE